MSGAPKMTIRQIAHAAGCDPDTVRIKAKELFPDRVQMGKRTEFTEPEAFRIAATLPKRNFVGAPTGNPVGHLPENGKVRPIPAGVQLRELRLMVERKILTPSHVQQVLGVYERVALAPPERPATSEEIEQGFEALRQALANPRRALPAGTVDRVARAAAGAARRTLSSIVAREEASASQPSLGSMS